MEKNLNYYFFPIHILTSYNPKSGIYTYYFTVCLFLFLLEKSLSETFRAIYLITCQILERYVVYMMYIIYIKVHTMWFKSTFSLRKEKNSNSLLLVLLPTLQYYRQHSKEHLYPYRSVWLHGVLQAEILETELLDQRIGVSPS